MKGIKVCMWWFLEDRVIASSPKAATRSLTKLFGAPQTNITKIQEKLSGQDVILFLRDPIQRLVSAYAYMKKRGDFFVNWPGLIDAILLGHQDMHWMPQIGQHTYEGRFLPTTVIPFEQLPAYISQMGFVLPHENKSTMFGDEDLNYRREEINEFYSEDIRVRSCLQQ